MDTPLIRSILEKYRADQNFQILSNNADLGEWLQRLGACPPIVRHFTACATDADAELASGIYFGAAGLREAHHDYPEVVDAGFVAIGCGEEAELIALDLQSAAVGFFPVEVLEAGCKREDFVFLDDSLSAFMQNLEQAGPDEDEDR